MFILETLRALEGVNSPIPSPSNGKCPLMSRISVDDPNISVYMGDVSSFLSSTSFFLSSSFVSFVVASLFDFSFIATFPATYSSSSTFSTTSTCEISFASLFSSFTQLLPPFSFLFSTSYFFFAIVLVVVASSTSFFLVVHLPLLSFSCFPLIK
jgi:hypothetical protein